MVSDRIDEYLRELGVQLAAERTRRGLTQRELSSRLGISARAISAIENGGSSQLKTILSYCEAVGASLALIVGRAERTLSEATPEKEQAQ